MRRRKLTSRSTSRIRLVADDDRPGAGFDQPDPPQDQRAHDPLAQIGLGDQQRAQPIRRDGHRLDIGQRLLVDQRRPARQLGELAHEVAPLMRDDVLAPITVAGWVTSTCPDMIEHQARPGFANLARACRLPVAARLTEPGEPRNLIVGEAQKHLRSTGRIGVAAIVGHSTGIGV